MGAVRGTTAYTSSGSLVEKKMRDSAVALMDAAAPPTVIGEIRVEREKSVRKYPITSPFRMQIGAGT